MNQLLDLKSILRTEADDVEEEERRVRTKISFAHIGQRLESAIVRANL